MKTTSIILTIALLLPITGEILRAYQTYLFDNHLPFTMMNKATIVRMYAPSLIFNSFALILAIVLTIKKKYLINTVMCATLVSGYIISLALFWGINMVFTWLKLG